MNIFVLDKSPVIAAQMQCDKHVVKMIVESAQMLCTAHRLLDGAMEETKKMVAGSSPVRWRKGKYWRLANPDKDVKFYKAVHMHHPCTLWTMETLENYEWHHQHFEALCDEYTLRYGKTHATETLLLEALIDPPENIKDLGAPTQFRLAMKSNPECMHTDDPVRSYQEFYQTKQDRFKMTWTKRTKPSWFITK
jgi:hypothetical protein